MASRKPKATIKQLEQLLEASNNRVEHLENAVGELQVVIQTMYSAIHGDVTRYEAMFEVLCATVGCEYIAPPRPEEEPGAEGNIEVSEEE
jgi:hypothetical protein